MTLSTSDLAMMQDTLEETLPDVATILRKQSGSDGQGGKTEDWQELAEVACRLSPAGLKAEEMAQDDRVTALGYRTITFPSGTDVTTADRIQVGDEVFEVQGIRAPRSWEISRRVECVKVG